MAMELKHLNPQHVIDVSGKAIDEISRLRAENAELNAENERLKEMMPEYEQFIKDEDFKKKLVDEYAGYVYEWAGHRYVATPYINVFIKGILRALWLARAKRARVESIYWLNLMYDEKWSAVKFTVKRKYGENIKLGQTTRTPEKWFDIWDIVELYCEHKAEEYK